MRLYHNKKFYQRNKKFPSDKSRQYHVIFENKTFEGGVE